MARELGALGLDASELLLLCTLGRFAAAWWRVLGWEGLDQAMASGRHRRRPERVESRLRTNRSLRPHPAFTPALPYYPATLPPTHLRSRGGRARGTQPVAARPLAGAQARAQRGGRRRHGGGAAQEAGAQQQEPVGVGVGVVEWLLLGLEADAGMAGEVQPRRRVLRLARQWLLLLLRRQRRLLRRQLHLLLLPPRG